MGQELARAFVSYFAIIDPVGNILVFYLLTQGLPWPRRALVAGLACLAAFLMLLVFGLAGEEVLDFLGITAASFQVAAGLLLVPPAYRLVERGQPLEVTEEGGLDVVQVALVPLATPLLAGPGAIATTVSFSQTLGAGTALAAAAAVLAISFLVFALANALLRLMGASLLRLLSRLVGILLVAIAVDLVLEGASAFFG